MIRLLFKRYNSISNFRYYKWPHRLMVRTPPFHGGNTGSNPVGVTTSLQDGLHNKSSQTS